EFPDVIPHSGVGRGVRTRGTPDRRLVHSHELVDVVEAVDPGMPPRNLPGPVETVRQHRREDIVDQRGLAGPGDPGDRDHATHRERHVDTGQIVLACPDNGDLPLLVRGAADVRHGNLPTPCQVVAGERLRVLQQLLVRTTVHDVPTVFTGSR